MSQVSDGRGNASQSPHWELNRQELREAAQLITSRILTKAAGKPLPRGWKTEAKDVIKLYKLAGREAEVEREVRLSLQCRAIDCLLELPSPQPQDKFFTVGRAVARIAHVLRLVAPDLDEGQSEYAACWVVDDVTALGITAVEEALNKYADEITGITQKEDPQ